MKISFVPILGIGTSSFYRLMFVPSFLQITSLLLVVAAETDVVDIPESVHFKPADPEVELIAETEDEAGGTRVLTSSNSTKAGITSIINVPIGKIKFHTGCEPRQICFRATLLDPRSIKSVDVWIAGTKYSTTKSKGCIIVDGKDEQKLKVKAAVKYCLVGPSCRVQLTGNSKEKTITVPKKCDGGGGGDPHFSTWDGTPYSYHGACDLVFAQSPTFADAMGLDIHVRTQIERTFSRISNVAVKIGGDILEVLVDGSHYYNGQAGTVTDAPSAMGDFPVRATCTCRKKDPSATSACAKFFCQYDVHLEGEDEAISITTFNGFLNVAVRSPLMNFRGLMGTYGQAGMFDRDGRALTDPIAMGSAWQVRDTEPMIFHNVEGPQYPEPCFLPAANARLSLAHTKQFHEKTMSAEGRRTLRGRDIEDPLHAEARAACNRANSFEGCVMDVLTTRDLDMALLYVSGNA